MKILMLGWELPPHNSGGLGTACLNLCYSLSKKGIGIDFVVPYGAKHEEINFMHILNATKIDPLMRFGCGAYDSDNKYFPKDNSINVKKDQAIITIRNIQERYCEYVDGYLKNHVYDCVHAHDWLTFEAGMLAKKRYGVPLVIHVHATEEDRSGLNSGNPLVREIEYNGLMLADRIVAVSEYTKNLIHSIYNIPLDKIEVVHNALDLSFNKQKTGNNKDQYAYLNSLKQKGYTIISTVGRFTVQKGLTHFLRSAKKALEKDEKLIFLLAGDGEEKDELISLASDLKISDKVIFTGFIRGKKLYDIYSLSDIFVMPSLSEPFGLTALEAAHFGNALILTKQSGVTEVIPSAETYDFWDEDLLAKKIINLSKNIDYREKLCKKINKEYKEISWDDAANKCINVYNAMKKRS